MRIPLANIILLFVWRFGRTANLNKTKLAQDPPILCLKSVIFIFFGGGAIMGALGRLWAVITKPTKEGRL